MAKRLEYGVSERAVDLCSIARFGDVTGIGRMRADRLAQNGYHDLSRLLAAEIGEIASLVDSRPRAEAFRSAVVRFLDDRSLHNEVDHANRASRLNRDAARINRFYSSQGTDFERAALDLLQTVFPDAYLRDSGDQSEPDLAIPVDSRPIVIECKTKRTEEGTVGLHDALAVIAKSAHLSTGGRVTLGKPQFDSLAVERSGAASVCLITHVLFCEAIVQVWESVLSDDDLIRLFQIAGLIDRNDLEDLRHEDSISGAAGG